ncbi:MAG: hypothetical protein JNJ99_00865 [Crocinitomicaceae bacterium]|nr:hypothetical protein [Crocinitomicaceae bacterium]
MNSEKFQPVLLEHYLKKELPENWLKEIYNRNWFKIFIPRRLGGLEMPLADGMIELMEAAAIHGSLGWCVNLGSGAGYFYRFIHAEAAEKIFADAKSVIAGSGQSTGKAVKTDGGYFLNGTWDKCSGAAHSTHFSANAVFEDGKLHTVIFERNKVKLSDSWNLFAMKATSSFSFSAENVFVPENFVFDIGVVKSEDSYTNSEIPFEIFARFCMISTLIGTVYCFCHHFEKEFSARIQQVEKDFENLKQKLESDKSSVLQLAKRYQSIAETHSVFPEQHFLNLQNGVALMSRSLFDAVNDIYYKTGISLSNENTCSHQAWRDVLMASQHGMVKMKN